jgi:hypothetical protein
MLGLGGAMSDQWSSADEYAIQFSESARASRKELPADAKSALVDVLEVLATNPNAFPNRIRAQSRDGKIRIYNHPSPALQITGTSKNRRFPPQRESDSTSPSSERRRLAWDSLVSSI